MPRLPIHKRHKHADCDTGRYLIRGGRSERGPYINQQGYPVIEAAQIVQSEHARIYNPGPGEVDAGNVAVVIKEMKCPFQTFTGISLIRRHPGETQPVEEPRAFIQEVLRETRYPYIYYFSPSLRYQYPCMFCYELFTSIPAGTIPEERKGIFISSGLIEDKRGIPSQGRDFLFTKRLNSF